MSPVDHPLRPWSAPGGVLPGIGAKVRLAPRTPRHLRTRGPIRCTCGGHAGMNRHGGGTPRWRPRASAREGPSAARTSRGWPPTPGCAGGQPPGHGAGRAPDGPGTGAWGRPRASRSGRGSKGGSAQAWPQPATPRVRRPSAGGGPRTMTPCASRRRRRTVMLRPAARSGSRCSLGCSVRSVSTGPASPGAPARRGGVLGATPPRRRLCRSPRGGSTGSTTPTRRAPPRGAEDAACHTSRGRSAMDLHHSPTGGGCSHDVRTPTRPGRDLFTAPKHALQRSSDRFLPLWDIRFPRRGDLGSTLVSRRHWCRSSANIQMGWIGGLLKPWPG